MIKKGFLLALFAIGVFANIFAQDTLSFKKTRDKNIYIEFLGASNLIVSYCSFDSSIKEMCSLYIPRLDPNPSSNLCLFPEVRKLTSIGKNSPLLELDALIKESPP
jgi:hypothetical protein